MSRAKRCCGNFAQEFKEYVTNRLLSSVYSIFSFRETRIEDFFCHRFALRGNVVDLAIGIIIGTVFTNVVQSLVDDIVTPPLGLILGGVDFANLTIKMKNFVYVKQPPVVIRYGKFIQTMISFFIMALTLFMVIKAINKLNKITKNSKRNSEKKLIIPPDATEEVLLVSEARNILNKKP